MPVDLPTEEQVRGLVASIAATRSRGRYIPPSASEMIVALCEDWLRMREVIAGIVNQDRWCEWNSHTEEGEPVLTMQEFGLLAELAGVVPRKGNHA
jgi:hypothetical protein